MKRELDWESLRENKLIQGIKKFPCDTSVKIYANNKNKKKIVYIEHIEFSFH